MANVWLILNVFIALPFISYSFIIFDVDYLSDGLIFLPNNAIDNVIIKEDKKEENYMQNYIDKQKEISSDNDDYDDRWKNGYVLWKVYPPFKELLEYRIHDRIKKAMSEIESKTCIKFFRIPDNVKLKETPWVRFYEEKNYTYPEGLNCMSVGGSLFPGQDLMLGKDCMTHSMILHELLHALGFLHEHQRPDRDDYLNVNLTGIPDYLHRQFEKISYMPTNLRKFDYESVLLYGPFDGLSGVKDRPVLTRKDGQRMLDRNDKPGLSKGDVDMINKHYNCPPKLNRL